MISILSKQLTFIAFLLLVLTNSLFAAPFEKEGKLVVFSGQDSQSRPFELTLTRVGDSLRGSYTHAGAPPEPVEGKLTPEGSIELIESKFGNIYGRFYAKLNGSMLNGEWSPVGAEQAVSITATARTPDVQLATIAPDPATADIKPSRSSRSEAKQLVDNEQAAATQTQAENLKLVSDAQTRLVPKQEPKKVGQENSNTLQYLLIAWLSVVIIGVLLGINDKIVVFRNYNDMAIAFCSGLSIAGTAFLLIGVAGKPQILTIFFIALTILSILWVIGRTAIDNRNPLYAVIALITKLTLFVLFIFNLIDFVTPSGKTARERAASRRSSFIMLLIIAPITLALVKDKTGLFCPDRMLRRRYN